MPEFEYIDCQKFVVELGMLEARTVLNNNKRYASVVRFEAGCMSCTKKFLRKYVPSSVPYKPVGNIGAAFASWAPKKGREVDYPQLVSGFSALVASFPAQKQLFFIDGHEDAQRFPFEAFAHKHHDVFADLVVSFPGRSIEANNARPKLSDIAMIMMMNSEHGYDPFKTDGLKHCKTVVQLAAHARNLMHAHGLTCAFVLGIYGDVLRICRFDRSGAVVSQPINLKDVDELEIVQEFFWRFVHPTEDVPFVGWDPTVRKLTCADREWLKARLDLANFDTKGALPFTEARRAEIFDDGSGGVAVDPRAYILFKAINVNGRLFSRGTTVWYGIRDTRISLDGCVVDPPGNVSPEDLKVRVIKDAWRQLGRRPETEFYRRLSIIPANDRVGLPSMVCGGDLGEREVQDWESALYGGPTPTPISADHHQSRLGRPASPLRVGPSSSPPASLFTSTSSPQLPVHRPVQQTFTWRQARGTEYWHRERSHIRFVIDEVGRPVTQFKNTRELTTAFRDAILGHRNAMRKGGILHRDISVGNILIVDDPDQQEQFCGFIHDFDYSSMSRDVPQGDISSLSATALSELLMADDVDGRLKERTGTFLFMSDELLVSHGPIVHDVRHDIHSFYWVLLWVVLRHTRHNLSDSTTAVDPLDACAKVFKQSSSLDAANAKRGWMWDCRYLVITGNGPLTALLSEYARLIGKTSYPERLPLDYDEVLDIFDRALAREDWPQSNDGPVRYTLPTLSPVNGWVFENPTPKPEKKSVHAHGKGEGKAAQVSSDSDSDSGDEIDENYVNELYYSDDEPDVHAHADEHMRNDADAALRALDVRGPRQDLPPLPPLNFSERLRIRDDDDDDDWGDAAEVSALIGHGGDNSDSDDGDIPMDAHDDSNVPSGDYHKLPSLLGRLKMALPRKKKKVAPAPGPDTAESAAAGPSRVTRGATRRAAGTSASAATPSQLNSGSGPEQPPTRVGPKTRARTRNGGETETVDTPHSGWSDRSGPRTRSATRGGNSGTTRSGGRSQTRSGGGRRARGQ
ncbi:hypothetical protein GSI_09779 [Ganoderma sinense ZZ0214-1]|uniref:Fungal-type protein kinase domain-containing protein n=1 Tax=Ganoderma sinense ZZ0214-1 TaxID=1077348 RepID=A0A2G8S3J1_9APHY|nr:hypothetical protein GSI_09779 [Ganoderma sinense ZZ0214-1]